MSEPWRVAVIGPMKFPDANRRCYARLKMLRDDWKGATFHIITSTTGQVASAALRAAKKLRMEYAAQSDPLERAERIIAYWDFECTETADQIRTALLRDLHVEVWNQLNEPAGSEAVEALGALA